MATKKQDVASVLDEQLLEISAKMRTMTVGSDQHSKAARDLSLLLNSKANLEKVQITKEDNTARLEEQKRMNDEEISMNKNRYQMETERFEAEMERQNAQQKYGLIGLAIDFLGRVVIPIAGMRNYSKAFVAAYEAEYALSEGSSKQPPNTVTRPLNDMKIRKPF